MWHAVEYLWEAGRGFLPEGSKALRAWAKKQESRLFDGRVDLVLRELRRRLAKVPMTGPGNKGRRARLTKAIRYIAARKDKMNYGSLRRRDLEISTGPVEGAIKNIIGRRQDHGGMRWIPERASLRRSCNSKCRIRRTSLSVLPTSRPFNTDAMPSRSC